jgi:hypothetical protein
MNRELAACAAIMKHAYYSRANRGSNWLWWMFIGLMMFAPAVAMYFSGKWASSIGYGAGVPLAVLILIWWVTLVPSIIAQNRGVASLVPGVGRRSVTILLVTWTVATVCLAALLGLAGLPAILVAEVVGFILAICAALAIEPLIGYLLWPFFLGQWFLPERVKNQVADFLPASLLFQLAPLIIAGLGYYVLRSVARGLPQAGAAASVWIRPESARLFGASRSYVRTLVRDCASGRIGVLLMHAGGPSLRGPLLLYVVLSLCLTIALILSAPKWVEYYGPGLRLIVPAVIFVLQLLIAPAIINAAYAARGEQSLVRLAPRSPGTGLFNAALAPSLLWEFARRWCYLTLLALAIPYLLGSGALHMLRIFVVCLLALAPIGLVLRDFTPSVTDYRVVRWPWVAALLAITLAGLFAATTIASPGSWLTLGVVTLAATLVVARIRWRAMLRAPVAFPAGRGN